jgi:hypothetical protein
MYRDGAAPGKIVLDNFQTNPSTATSSLRLAVGFTVTTLTEGDLDDNNTAFTDSVTDPMNGMTVNGTGADDSKAWCSSGTASASYYAYLVPGGGPASLWKYISFPRRPGDARTR